MGAMSGVRIEIAYAQDLGQNRDCLCTRSSYQSINVFMSFDVLRITVHND